MSDKNKNTLSAEGAKRPKKPFDIVSFIRVTVVLIVFIGLPVLVLSNISYSFYSPRESAIKVAFQHTGKRIVDCDEKDLIKEEGQRYRELLKTEKRISMNMGKLAGCPRERFPVVVALSIDGKTILDKAYKPKGIKKDMASYIYDDFIINPGVHRITVAMYDSGNKNKPDSTMDETVDIKPGEIKVFRFDNASNKLVVE
jgi:hypothetical protein